MAFIVISCYPNEQNLISILDIQRKKIDEFKIKLNQHGFTNIKYRQTHKDPDEYEVTSNPPPEPNLEKLREIMTVCIKLAFGDCIRIWSEKNI